MGYKKKKRQANVITYQTLSGTIKTQCLTLEQSTLVWKKDQFNRKKNLNRTVHMWRDLSADGWVGKDGEVVDKADTL